MDQKDRFSEQCNCSGPVRPAASTVSRRRRRLLLRKRKLHGRRRRGKTAGACVAALAPSRVNPLPPPRDLDGRRVMERVETAAANRPWPRESSLVASVRRRYRAVGPHRRRSHDLKGHAVTVFFSLTGAEARHIPFSSFFYSLLDHSVFLEENF